MKKHRHLIIMAGIALFSGILPPLAQQAHAQTSVSFQVFYDQLSPYGSWVNYQDYGYVWVPGQGSGFRPYGTRGHWVYTEEGWTWVSDYHWGWATFHYGNWFYDDSYGWMWTPGYQWAPAWVTWGESGGNYCWAPIGPRVDIGVSYGTYRPPARYWNFCPREHITSVNVSNYYVRNMHNTTVINNITVINNVNRGNGGHAYLRGPQSDNVERFTHRPVRPVAIQASSRPGAASVRNGHLAIYRPTVQNNNPAARPTQIRDLHAMRPANNNHDAAPGQPANNHPTPGRPVTNPGQPHQRPAPTQPGNPPAQQPGRPSDHPVQHPPVQQHPVTPPVQHQPRPGQPNTNPGQPRPAQQPPSQPPPQHPVQIHPNPPQPHPNPGPRPMQPRPAPAPRPVAPPHQNPPPQQHQNPPAPQPSRPEHHQ